MKKMRKRILSAIIGIGYLVTTSFSSAMPCYAAGAELTLTPTDVTESSGLNVTDEQVGGTSPGSWIKFDDVDFGDGSYNQVTLTAALGDGNPGYDTSIKLDSVNGTEIAKLVNAENGASGSWIKQEYTIDTLFTTGVHDVYLVFSNWGTMNFYAMKLFNNPEIKGTSSYLHDLSSPDGTITPVFDRNHTQYEMTVESGISSVQINAPTEDKNASATLNGTAYTSTDPQNVMLEKNRTEVVISVTAEDGNSSKEYRLTIYKKSQIDPENKELYVSVDGSDENSGLTESEPLQSLSYAMAISEPGTTIRLAAGTYTFTQQVTLKDGVSIVGAGMDQTILESKIKYTGDSLDSRGDFTPNGYLLAGENLTDVSISDLTLVNGYYNVKTDEDFVSGGHDLGFDSAHGGINIIGAENVNIHNLYFDSFNFTGMFLAEAQNCNIYQNKFYNSGKSGQEECIGSLTIDNLTDCTIHDNIFRETRGGYGIKSKPRAFSTSPRTTKMTNLKIYNNDMEGRQAGGWLAGTWAAGNFSIELWNAVAQQVDIYNNKFTGCLSLVCNEEYDSQPYSYKIYNNLFLHDTMKEYTASGSIEAGYSNAEIFNNYFEYGISTMTAFSTHTYKNVNIHDNVFNSQEMTCQLGYTGSAHNINMSNNIIYLDEETMQDTRYRDDVPYEGRGAFYPFRVSGEDNLNINLKNNVLFAENDTLGGERLTWGKIDPAELHITGNTLFNWDVEELSDPANISADPMLNVNDMRLAYNSPAFEQGFTQIDLSNTGIMEDAYFSPDDQAFRRIFLLEDQVEKQENLIVLDEQRGETQLTVKGVTTDGYLKSQLAVDSYEVETLEGDTAVSVSADGLVKAVGIGIAKVTAHIQTEDGDLTSTVYVQVTGLRVDKSALSALVEKAENIPTEKYTEDSVKVLEEAIEAAKAVLVNEKATQDEVNAQVSALNAAIEGLEQKEDSSSSEPEESKPDEGDSDTDGEESKNPSTGDKRNTTAIWLAIGCACTVMAAAVIIRRRESHQNR